MRKLQKLCITMLLTWILIPSIQAADFHLPDVPPAAQDCMPVQQDDLIGGLGEILTNALQKLMPSFREAGKQGLRVLAVAILCGIARPLESSNCISATRLLGVCSISTFLLESTHTFLRLGVDAVKEIETYSQLLLPTISAALVASGGSAKATALYLGTAFCNSVLVYSLSHLMEPLIFTFVASSIASAATGNDMLRRMAAFFRGCMVWCLKLVLYIFTGYMTVTGVISGSVDAIAMRATKLAISGAVPIVGGIISDASEAILVGAEAVRSTLGLGGVFVVLSIAAIPFLKVALQHIVLKLTGALCSIVGDKCYADLVDAFGQAMGLILAMVGTACLLQLISAICFLKGIGR